MRIAIVIDNWKLSIFKHRLRGAGYVYEASTGLTPDTRNLYVETDDVEALGVVVKAANEEARLWKEYG
jgi:hypothetical protein